MSVSVTPWVAAVCKHPGVQATTWTSVVNRVRRSPQWTSKVLWLMAEPFRTRNRPAEDKVKLCALSVVFIVGIGLGIWLGNRESFLQDPRLVFLVSAIIAFKAIDEIASNTKDEDHWFDQALADLIRLPKSLLVLGTVGYALGTSSASSDLISLYAFLFVIVIALVVPAAISASKPDSATTPVATPAATGPASHVDV